jgi:hypothetical protein
VQLGEIPSGEIQEGIGVGHAEVGASRGPDDLVAGLDLSLTDDAHVETGTAVADEKGWQLRLTETEAHAIAADPRLGELELGLTDAIAVADADLVVGQAIDGEVLADLTVAQAVATEVLLPMSVGLELVHQDGSLLATVAVQAALSVPIDVAPPDHRGAVDRLLPDTRAQGSGRSPPEQGVPVARPGP